MNLTFDRKEHAVVIGASISGLLAARAQANHFTRVTVIERDILPAVGEPRKGAPQGRHAHVLLAHGRELLEGFFPGLTQELVAMGARAGDLSETSCWFSGGVYTRNFLKASVKDNDLNIAFQRVTNLIDPPASLFRPNIVLRVVSGNIKR